MDKVTLKAEARKLTGRKVKQLRKEGIVPANIYGKDVKSVAVQVNSKEFRETFKKAGETGIIELALGKDSRPVLVHDVQVHPATDVILHVDFRQVNLKEKVTANIPVELVGESPAQKGGIGTVVVLLQEIEVEALPTDLPEAIKIDASKLVEVDQAVKVADLKLGKEVEVKADPEAILVKVEPPTKEEEPVVAPTPAEGEAPAEGAKSAEGEAPSEGEKKEEAPKAEGQK